MDNEYDNVALATRLATEPEYKNMKDYITLPQELIDSIDEDVMMETKLTSVSNVMNLLYMDVQGHSMPRMAMVLGISLMEVEIIRKSQAYSTVRESLLREILNTARNVMQVSTLKAVKSLYECMESTDERIKLQAAKEILDRVGLSGTQKLEVVATQGGTIDKLTNDDLAEILRSSMEVISTNGSNDGETKDCTDDTVEEESLG